MDGQRDTRLIRNQHHSHNTRPTTDGVRPSAFRIVNTPRNRCRRERRVGVPPPRGTHRNTISSQVTFRMKLPREVNCNKHQPRRSCRRRLRQILSALPQPPTQARLSTSTRSPHNKPRSPQSPHLTLPCRLIQTSINRFRPTSHRCLRHRRQSRLSHLGRNNSNSNRRSSNSSSKGHLKGSSRIGSTPPLSRRHFPLSGKLPLMRHILVIRKRHSLRHLSMRQSSRL